MATTNANTSVTLTWASVPGAQSYVIERAASRQGSRTPVASAAGTAINLSAPASVQPVTYVYYVRSVGENLIQSDVGAHDYATTATALFGRSIAVDVVIDAADIVELRKGVDALRQLVGLGNAFSGGPASGDPILASDITGLIGALDQARGAYGQPAFSYVGVPIPALGGEIYAQHVLQLRDALR